MKPELKTRKIENKEKLSRHKTNLGLAAYINPQEIFNQEAHDQAWKKLLKNWQNLDCLEIQYEHDYLKNWWLSLPTMLRNYNSKIIVHGPTQKRDIASVDDQLLSRSLAENKKALDLTAALGAEAMILHITPQDDFDLRLAQLDRAFSSFTKLSEYIKERNYPVSLMLENLEYPKWPADTKEAVDLLKHLREIHPNLTSCVDLAHLWHNHTALMPGINYSSQNFPDILIDYIVEVNSIAPIRRFHFAGAFVDKKNDIHQTHGAPELNGTFQSTEFLEIMPIIESLKIMDEFIKMQTLNGEPTADIILEMHIAHQEQEQALNTIKKYLKDKIKYA